MLSTMLALALTAAPLQNTVQDSAHVVLVATTDVHGHATHWDYLTDTPFAGGLARAGTVIDSLRKRYPGQLVVVDAGDLIQGEPFATYAARIGPRDPHPVVEAMNVIGYDAATPGNHEFNFGLAAMRRAIAGAAFPYVSGNIYTLPADTLTYPPYVVLPRGGMRVAVAGFTTPGVMVWDRENVKGQVRVAPIGASAPPVLRRMRGAADLSIVLIHSGMAGRASYDTAGIGDEDVAASLARMPNKPDLVVVGHSHREMRDSVIDGVHFVQPKNYAQSLSVVHLDAVRRGGRWQLERVRAELVPLADVPPSERVMGRLAKDHAAVRAWVNEPLGTAAGPMPSAMARAEASPIVGFINAVQRQRTGAELSAASAFNLRAGFVQGPIRLADVAAIYPYENTLKAVRLSGGQLKGYLEQSARYFRVDSLGRISLNDSIPGYNYDMVAGATYDIDLRLPPGSRIRNLAVRGRPVGPTDSFTIALNNYRQGGGGGFDMLRGAPVVYDRNENVRDLLVDAIRQRKRIDPKDYAEPSWRIVPAAAAEQVRGLFGAPPPAKVAPRPPRDSIMLRVLATNDLHGALLPRVYAWSKGRPVGGVPVLKAMMDSAEAQCACPTLRLDAGDQMQGTLISNLSEGRATVEAFNGMGLDAAAVGNHDLDWSVPTLRQRMAESRYPWLAANVFDSASGRRPDWAVPYKVLDAGGLRVAVIGYMEPSTKTIVRAEYVRGLTFGRGVAPIRDVLDSVRARKPDVTILLAHLGAFCDTTACTGDVVDLARELGPGSVDLIVAGHTHSLVSTVVAGIPIVEAQSRGTALGIADLVRTPVGTREMKIRVETTWADSTRGDSALAALVETYRVKSDSLASQVVARIKLPLGKDDTEGTGQYPLGNLIADAQRNVARADVAIMNNGGIRSPGLSAGPVNYGQVFSVQPFQNTLLRLKVSGAVLRRALEHALAGDKPDAHVSGMTVRYDASRPAGQRVRGVRLLNGRRLDDRATYSLALLDFLATGGSGFDMFAGAPAERTGYTDVDALILYLKRLGQPVEAPAAPRFVRVAR
jgi:2',3'-cyclic-nucleotide 2'-phosphodiesterase/3'-nucleotidase/5'-nucleotidase